MSNILHLCYEHYLIPDEFAHILYAVSKFKKVKQGASGSYVLDKDWRGFEIKCGAEVVLEDSAALEADLAAAKQDMEMYRRYWREEQENSKAAREDVTNLRKNLAELTEKAAEQISAAPPPQPCEQTSEPVSYTYTIPIQEALLARVASGEGPLVDISF
jgi:hypothetical protein